MQGCPAQANAMQASAALAPLYSTVAVAELEEVIDWLFGWAHKAPGGLQCQAVMYALNPLTAGNLVWLWHYNCSGLS